MEKKQIVGAVSANLINAMLFDFESETGSHREGVARGAVFALARLAHELDIFEAVIRASAEDLVMSVQELRGLLPTARDCEDATELFDSIS